MSALKQLLVRTLLSFWKAASFPKKNPLHALDSLPSVTVTRNFFPWHSNSSMGHVNLSLYFICSPDNLGVHKRPGLLVGSLSLKLDICYFQISVLQSRAFNNIFSSYWNMWRLIEFCHTKFTRVSRKCTQRKHCGQVRWHLRAWDGRIVRG